MIGSRGSLSRRQGSILPAMARTLGEFLAELDRAEELRRVQAPVSPMLEIAAITDRVSRMPCANPSAHAASFDPEHCRQGGRALLFENVEGCDFPLAINVFGSYRRMEMALGVAESGGFEAIARRIAQLTKPRPPASLGEMVQQARMFLPLLRTPPKRKRSGRCQEVVKLARLGEVDLTRLPLIKCWPLDGDPLAVGSSVSSAESGTAGGAGRYITFAGMHTIHADDAGAAKPASHNIGMYRAQLIDATHLVMHWHIVHDGAAHWRSWKKKGEPMPIAICFGGEPVLPYAATAPLPPGVSELLMAGFLNGRGIPMVRCKTVPLWVPANSEIVIEGYVSTECGEIGFDPRETPDQLGPGAAFEGPFGDHTGFYSLPDRYPIVEVTAVTHARQAVFPATIVGLPPQEDYYLGKATERIFLPLLKTLIPDIVDYHLPRFGCFHNCAFLQIDKQYPLQARRVMHAVWGAGQMAWTKMIVVVDSDVNVHDERAVLEAIARRCHFRRDVEIVDGPLDILDHAAPRLGAGHKIGFDATRKMPGEECAGVPVDHGELDLPGLEAIRKLDMREVHAPEWGGGRVVFVGVEKGEPGQGIAAIESVWDRTPDSAAALVIALNADVDLTDDEAVWFHLCANCDPGRDQVRRENRFGLDGTTKFSGDERHGQPVRDYPPRLQMNADTIGLIERRWEEYGLPQRCEDAVTSQKAGGYVRHVR